MLNVGYSYAFSAQLELTSAEVRISALLSEGSYCHSSFLLQLQGCYPTEVSNSDFVSAKYSFNIV